MTTWSRRENTSIHMIPRHMAGCGAKAIRLFCATAASARCVGISALTTNKVGYMTYGVGRRRLRKPLMQTHRSGGIVECRPRHHIRGLSSLIPATAQIPRCGDKPDSHLGSRLRPSVRGRISWVIHDLGYPVRVLIREGICGLSTANNDSGRTLNHNAGGGKRHCGRTKRGGAG